MKKITQLLAKHPAILLLMLLTTLSFSSKAAVTCDVTETHGQGFTTSITDVIDNCDGSFTITLRVDHDGCPGPGCKELSHYAIEADKNTYSNVSVSVLNGSMNYSSIDMGWNLGGNTSFKGFKIDGISGIGDGMAGSFEVTYTLTGGLQDQQTKAKAGNSNLYVSFSIADFESVMNCNGTGCGGPNAGLNGNVFHDINGLSDNTVNGTGIGQASAQTIYVHLLNFNAGTVLDVKAVNNDGTYSFDAAAGQYKVLISTTQGSVGSGAPQVNLPNGWVNTGENVGAGAGNDNNPNGILNATVVANQYTSNVNFGIEQRPVPENNTAASQENPGGAISVEVPAATFEANDPDGIVTYIKITAFPSNATSININGNNYTSATFPGAGVWVPTNSTGNPTQIILVDPVDGAVTVSIPFIAKDNAGIVSTGSGSANLPFTMPVLVGPTANDDNATTPMNTPVDINALQNDTPGDAALDPTTVTFIAGTEPDANTEGVFTVNGTTGLVTFTPATGYTGTVTIDYQVCDLNALCDVATITVVIEPAIVGPTTNNDNATTLINTPVDIDVLDNDIAGSAALDPTTVTFIAGTEPDANTEGVFTVNGTTGLVTFTPATGYTGTVTIDYQVCDLNALCDIATITVVITPSLTGPTAIDDFATTLVNTPVDIIALSNDVAGSTPLDPTTVTFIAGTEPDAATEGVFTVDGTTGLVTFTPANNYVGVVTIDYQVCDQNALCDIATITVTIVDGNGNFYPAHGYGTLAYEDLWPAKGDYDFNDLVIDYQFEILMNQANYINQVKATFIIRAFGASYENGFGFQLSETVDADDLTVSGYSLTESFITLNPNGTEAGQSKATIIVYDNAYNEMQHPGVGIGVNTEPSAPYVQPATLTVIIDFEPNKYTYNQLDIANFNPFIIVNKDRALEVHLPNYPPTDLADQSKFGMWDDDSDAGTGKYYLTANNLPWAIHIYESFDYPIEKQDIIWVHLKFAEWATSGGLLYPNWYKDLSGFRNDNLIYTPPSN
jgi:LruC domain-containing protein